MVRVTSTFVHDAGGRNVRCTRSSPTYVLCGYGFSGTHYTVSITRPKRCMMKLVWRVAFGGQPGPIQQMNDVPLHRRTIPSCPAAS